MLDEAAPLPDDPGGLKALAQLLITEVKAQAALIEKLHLILPRVSGGFE